jgi:Uma2 family endonuclease
LVVATCGGSWAASDDSEMEVIANAERKRCMEAPEVREDQQAVGEIILEMCFAVRNRVYTGGDFGFGGSAMNVPISLSAIDEAIKEDRYEVVNGQYVELPPMSAREVDVASELVGNMRPFSKKQKLGRVVSEMLFHLADDLPERRPDVALVSVERWPLTRPVPATNAWAVVPNLAVEVISPTNTWDEIIGKIGEYFRAGVQRVWVVVTSAEQVHVYDSPTQVRILTRDQELTDETLLPGFRLPLSQLFEREIA